MNLSISRVTIFILTFLVVAIAIIFSSPKYLASTRTFTRFYSRSPPIVEPHQANLNKNTMSTSARTPVYFLSHGGPNIMYEKEHAVYSKLQEIGREITQRVKPKAVVVFSAHWQGEPKAIEINTFEITELIYDFYGFPTHYYEEKYPNVGSKEVANKVIDSLTSAGIKTEPMRRGLDHGVWASFKVAFDPETNPLNVPIVQVSLFASEDASQHYALGRAVSSLREQGIVIIVSGMAVHNLRDMRFGFSKVQSYAESFDEALREAVESDPEEREAKMAALLLRKDARSAHPTFEHLLPIHVGAGAAYQEKGKRLWTLAEGSFSWAQYRFGEVNA